MPNIAILGAQWGDEGKGKIVDLLSDRFDVVARFQGGPNAGHTVTFDGRRHALHHVPSGVFRPSTRIVIGNGTVVDPAKLLEELDGLDAAGIRVDGRFYLSDRAHVILPIHRRLDALEESAADSNKIGTTLRGIGPTYQAKAARWGLRVADLANPDQLAVALERIVGGAPGERLRAAGETPGSVVATVEEIHAQYARLAPYVTDTALLLNDWLDQGLAVIFEGAQGTMLDLDHGSYPYVTSSNTLCGALCSGLGIAPSRVDGAIGVFKAYSTRVGSGPMPTELADAHGERLRERGREYGTTTGRPRRCGWFDGVAASYAYRINRYNAACISLLDVLDDFDEIRIGIGYRLDGREQRALPADTDAAARIEPVFESLPGWKTDTTAMRSWDALPPQALAFLERLGEVIGTDVAMVGVGPDRQQTIVRPGSWVERLIAESSVRGG